MRKSHRNAGFSMIELTVVIVILGVLIAMGVPKFMSSVEKTKAREGINYLRHVELQQSRYMANHGRYASSYRDLEEGTGESMEKPEFFNRNSIQSPNWETKWKASLTRNGASSGYGRYTIWWSQDGYLETESSIPDDIKPNLGNSSGGGCSGPIPSSRGIAAQASPGS